MSFFFRIALLFSFFNLANSFAPAERLRFMAGDKNSLGKVSKTCLSVASTGRDFYEILGISPYTDAKEIKQAFRKLAKEYHPDVNKDSASKDRFYELYKAYAVLRDPEKRIVYNMYGEEGLKRQQSPPEEEEEEDPDAYDPYAFYTHEAEAFQNGIGQNHMSGEFHLGGVFQEIQPPEFGDHINLGRNSVSCNFGDFLQA